MYKNSLYHIILSYRYAYKIDLTLFVFLNTTCSTRLPSMIKFSVLPPSASKYFCTWRSKMYKLVSFHIKNFQTSSLTHLAMPTKVSWSLSCFKALVRNWNCIIHLVWSKNLDWRDLWNFCNFSYSSLFKFSIFFICLLILDSFDRVNIYFWKPKWYFAPHVEYIIVAFAFFSLPKIEIIA